MPKKVAGPKQDPTQLTIPGVRRKGWARPGPGRKPAPADQVKVRRWLSLYPLEWARLALVSGETDALSSAEPAAPMVRALLDREDGDAMAERVTHELAKVLESFETDGGHAGELTMMRIRNFLRGELAGCIGRRYLPEPNE